MSVEVIRPGLFSTLQDRGRGHLAHLGISHSGAADTLALRAANRLLNNPDFAAGIESLTGGLSVRAHADHRVCVSGAHAEVRIDGVEHQQLQLLQLRAGQTLTIAKPSAGLRTYLCVEGGFLGTRELDSFSYDQLGKIGTPPLRRGDVLHTGKKEATPSLEPRAFHAPSYRDREPLDVHLGPRADWLQDEANFYGSTWNVSTDSNRIGIRLIGEPLRVRESQLLSEGQLPGSIQLPPSGLPILLGPDAGTTGGYPVIAVVASQHLHRIGQLRPGQAITFRRLP